MDGERLKNVGEATAIVALSKIAADKISEKVGNPFLGGALVAGAGLFLVKGQRGTLVAAGAFADIAEELIRRLV